MHVFIYTPDSFVLYHETLQHPPRNYTYMETGQGVYILWKFFSLLASWQR